MGAWYASCFTTSRREVLSMYPILYVVGAIVVLIVVLRLLGLV